MQIYLPIKHLRSQFKIALCLQACIFHYYCDLCVDQKKSVKMAAGICIMSPACFQHLHGTNKRGPTYKNFAP